MRRLIPCSLLLISLSAAAAASTIRLIELRGHARVLASDEPILKGRVYVFHRYPDGVFLSVPAEEVSGIATTKVEEEKAKFRPGETIVLGPTGEGRAEESFGPGHEAAPSPPLPSYPDYPYAFYPYAGCCSGPRPGPPPRPSAPPPPALVGPNGFPGTPMREIGPNGFPVLAPSPAAR